MGSGSSKNQDTSKYGDIYLQTDKATYNPGETVTGTIHLNLKSEYPGNQVFLKIKGGQTAHVVEHHHVQTRKTFDTKHSESNVIIKEVVLVRSWANNNLAPGQFSIPFSFLLDETLPASFYQQGHRYLAFIEYQIEAFLMPHKTSDPKMKSKQPLTIRDKVTPMTEEVFSESVTTELQTCWCCSKGSNTLKATFNKNCFSPQDRAEAKFEFDNSGTTLKAKNVMFSFGQLVQITANGHTHISYTRKATHQVPTVSSGQLNVIVPKFATKADFKEISRNPNKFTLLALRDNTNVITSSTRSSLIQSTYHLEVTCPMSGCCANDPIVMVAVDINRPDIQLPTVTAPEDWQPIALASIALAFPSSQNQAAPSEMNGQMSQNNMPNVQMAQISQPNQYSQNY